MSLPMHRTDEITADDLVAICKQHGGSVTTLPNRPNEVYLDIDAYIFVVCVGDYYKDGKRVNHAVAEELGMILLHREINKARAK